MIFGNKYEVEEWPKETGKRFVPTVNGFFLANTHQNGLIACLDWIGKDTHSKISHLYMAAKFKTREEAVDWLRQYKEQWELQGIKKEEIKFEAMGKK